VAVGAPRTSTRIPTDQLGGLADKATDQARNVAQHVEEFTNNTAQQGHETAERVQRSPAMKGAVDKSIKDQQCRLWLSPRPLVSPFGALRKS
jgi:hypothetical protein